MICLRASIQTLLVSCLVVESSLAHADDSAKALEGSTAVNTLAIEAGTYTASSPPWQAEIPFKPSLGEGSYLVIFPPIEGIKATLQGEEGNIVRFTGPLEVTGTVVFVNGTDNGTIPSADLPDEARPPSLTLYPDWSIRQHLPLALYKGSESIQWPVAIHLGFQIDGVRPQMTAIWGGKAAEKLLNKPNSRRIEYGKFKFSSFSTFVECDHRYYMAEISEYAAAPKSQQGRQLLPADKQGC